MEGIEDRHPVLHRRNSLRRGGVEHPQDPMIDTHHNNPSSGPSQSHGLPARISVRMFLDRSGFGCLMTARRRHSVSLSKPCRIAAAIRAYPATSPILPSTIHGFDRTGWAPLFGNSPDNRFPSALNAVITPFVSTRVEDPVRDESDTTPSSIYDAPSTCLIP
jgi:hypothetical protein